MLHQPETDAALPERIYYQEKATIMMPLTIEHWPVGRLVPYARNPRKNDEAVDKMVAAIREFGFRIPVVAKSDGSVVDGHLRLKAAHKMGMDTVPVALADELTDAQVKAFRLLANRSVNWADWDDDLLKLEFEELVDMGFDLELTGFDSSEIDAMLAVFDPDDALTDPDDELEIPAGPPVSQLGDVWILGNHRIICGDCTDASVVERLLAGARPHLMVTDPPYGIEYDADWRNDALAGKPRADGKIGGGGRAVGVVLNDDVADWRDAWALFPGDVAYVWHADKFSNVVADSLSASRFIIRNLIVWAKNNLVIGRGDYHNKHEPCWYVVRKGATGHWNGDRKQTTLWEIDKPMKSETGHSTQKPVECMKRPIENNSLPGDAVYEPFSGSGTTIIAGEMTGRRVYAVELNPAYVDIACTRWSNFTGKPVMHEQTGKTFEQVAEDRVKENGDAD